MPIPRKGETKKDFISRCIGEVTNEGRERDQAVAICNSLWNERKSMNIKILEDKIYKAEPSVLIIHKGKNILINTPKNFDRFLREKIDILLFTHGHNDNIEGIKKIIKFKNKNSLITCYCDKVTRRHIRRIWKDIDSHLDIRIITSDSKIDDIEFIPIIHKIQEGYETYGIIIDKTAFITQTYKIQKSIWKKLDNCEWLITGAKYLREEKYKDNQSLLSLSLGLKKSKIKNISLLGVSNSIKKRLPFRTLQSGDVIGSVSTSATNRNKFINCLEILLKARLEDVNDTSIKNETDKKLLLQYKALHNLYSLWKSLKGPRESIDFLFIKNLIITKEITRRGLQEYEVRDELEKRAAHVLEKQNYPNVTIIDDEFIKIVGASLSAKNYDDVDILVNVKKYSKKINSIIKENIKGNKRLHIAFGKKIPYGNYKSVGILISKEGMLNNDEHLIAKKGYKNFAIIFIKDAKIKEPIVKPKYFKKIDYYSNDENSRLTKLVVEPLYNTKSISFIHKKDGAIKYSKGISKHVANDAKNIKGAIDFILVGIPLKNHFYLIDILAKNDAWIGNEALTKRKYLLSKLDISGCKSIDIMPYKIAIKDSLKKIIANNRFFNRGAIIKGTLSKYNDKLYILKAGSTEVSKSTLRKYFKKNIDLPKQDVKLELKDRMIERILKVDTFGQEKIIKSISPYKVAIYSKALHNFYKSKENKIIDLKWEVQYAPATFELLETKRNKRERLLVSGYILIKDKHPLVINFTPGYRCQYLTMYCRKEDIGYMEKTLHDFETYVKDNNYYKNEKITPFGDFLPLSTINKSDIILEEETIKRLEKTVFSFFDNKKKYEKLGVPFKRGVIFSGLPGTGKTLSGKIIMNNIKDISFIWVTARDFQNLSTGYLFEMARELQPAVLFIEDVDRELKGTSLDIIKTQMDGLYSNDGIMIILSTNFPGQLPKTLIDRPGRFDDVIEFNLPDTKLRFKILMYYGKKIEIVDREKTLLEIAKMSKGLTPAHLKEILVSAYMNSKEGELHLKDLENSFSRINQIHDKFKSKK